MKKISIFILTCIILNVGIFILTGCDTNDNKQENGSSEIIISNNNYNENSKLGTYELQYMENSLTGEKIELDNWEEETGNCEYTLNVKQDFMQITYSYNSHVKNIKYSYNEKSLFDEENQEAYLYETENDTIILNDQNSGYKYIYKKI